MARNFYLCEKIQVLKTIVKTQSAVIKRHEREMGRNNLIIRGIDGGVWEAIGQCKPVIADNAVESVCRVARRSERGPRPMKLSLLHFLKKTRHSSDNKRTPTVR